MWGAIASAAGSAGGGIYSTAEARRNARNQRDWTLEMSQTAHQREVRDLRKAGLNPILSAGGKGAAIGPGATAVTPDLASAAGTAVSSAVSAARAKADIRNVNTQQQQNKVELQLQRGMLDFYQKNPGARAAADAARLANQSGLNPNIGAGAGLWGSAQEAIKQNAEAWQLNRAERHYNRLNRDLGKARKKYKDPKGNQPIYLK